MAVELTDASSAHTKLFPGVPENRFDFDPLTLIFRHENDQDSEEAIGPAGKRAQANIHISDNKPGHEAMGQAMLAGDVGHLYRAWCRKAFAEGRGVRILLDFRGRAWEPAILGLGDWQTH